MAAKGTSTRTTKKEGQTSGRKSASGSRTVKKASSQTSGKRKAAAPVRKPEEPDGMNSEIILMVVLVLSVLLLLSNFNLCGAFGDVISQVMYGLFGLPAFLFPFVLFFGTAFILSNKGNRRASRKTFGAVALWISVTALIQLFSSGYDSEMRILEYYTFSAENKSGGGLIGGAICRLLCPLFGTVGTFVILFALVILCIMFLTGKALFAYISRMSEEKLAARREERSRRITEPERYEEDYEEEFASGDVTAADHPKRPARTVMLKKPERSAAEPAGKKRAEKARSLSEEEPFDMEELYPSGSDVPSDSFVQDVNKIYEEELKLKFGKRKDEAKEPSAGRNVEPQRREIYDKEDAALEFDAGNMPWENSSELLYDSGEKKEQEGIPEAADAGALGFPPEAESFPDTGTVLPDSETVQEEDYILNTEPASETSPVQEPKSAGKAQAAAFTGAGRESAGKDPAVSGQLQAASPDMRGPEFPAAGMRETGEEPVKEYVFPPIDLLSKPNPNAKGATEAELKETAAKLQKTLESFGVRVTITNVSCGPAVTRYELQPEQGVKVSRITGLADDIKLNLAAADVRIEAPIPGKAAVGIEVPNKENTTVMFRELIDSSVFRSHPSDIAFAVGKDIGGQIVVTDIAKMPHLLIAGATGSGKSVCINTLIMSILYKAKPSEVRLIMVDPKVVELSVYNGIPHLLIPVVTDPKKASAALNWAVMEMTDRYQKFAELGVRDLKGYNEKVASVLPHTDEKYPKLPQIVIIVDELADLMMVAPGEVEDAICRLAQMARAAGLHLIIATQRPSVNVITGLIKANIPSRIAFSVSSAIDSRTIIDSSGAEKLLGKGDMLFFPSGYPKPIRVQGAFVSDKEVSAVVDFLKSESQAAPYSEDVNDKIANASAAEGGSGSSDRDDYFIEAGKFIIEKDKASIGMLQRVYKIGFNRAARIMDQLAEAGVVGPEEGTKPRKVLMSLEEFEQYVDDYV